MAEDRDSAGRRRRPARRPPSATDEWRFPNQATPLGSAAYYSLRFAPRDLRDGLAALTAWQSRIHAVPDRVSDPDVARIKLQWWCDELERTFTGAPRHPLSRVLQPVIARHRLPQALFTGIADHAEQEILRRRSTAGVDPHPGSNQDLGLLFELITRCHGPREAEVLETTRRLGDFCARVYLIRDRGAPARSGPTMPQPEATDAEPAIADTDMHSGIPVCIRIRARISASLLQVLADENFEVADRRIGLTPLYKLWLAWRESRRA